MSLVSVLNNKNLESFKINKTEIIELIQSGIEDQIDNRKAVIQKELDDLNKKMCLLPEELQNEIIAYCNDNFGPIVSNYIRAHNEFIKIMSDDSYHTYYKYSDYFNFFFDKTNTLYLTVGENVGSSTTKSVNIPETFIEKVKMFREEQKKIEKQIYNKKCELNKLNNAEKNLPKLVRKQRAMITREILEGEAVGKELLQKIDMKVDELIGI